MIVKTSTGMYAVVGRWATKEEGIEVDIAIGRSLTVDEQVVMLSPEAFAEAMFNLGTKAADEFKRDKVKAERREVPYYP